jgi:hypothetical protein
VFDLAALYLKRSGAPRLDVDVATLLEQVCDARDAILKEVVKGLRRGLKLMTQSGRSLPLAAAKRRLGPRTPTLFPMPIWRRSPFSNAWCCLRAILILPVPQACAGPTP